MNLMKDIHDYEIKNAALMVKRQIGVIFQPQLFHDLIDKKQEKNKLKNSVLYLGVHQKGLKDKFGDGYFLRANMRD